MSPESLQVVESIDVVESVPVESLEYFQYLTFIESIFDV